MPLLIQGHCGASEAKLLLISMESNTKGSALKLSASCGYHFQLSQLCPEIGLWWSRWLYFPRQSLLCLRLTGRFFKLRAWWVVKRLEVLGSLAGAMSNQPPGKKGDRHVSTQPVDSGINGRCGWAFCFAATVATFGSRYNFLLSRCYSCYFRLALQFPIE